MRKTYHMIAERAGDADGPELQSQCAPFQLEGSHDFVSCGGAERAVRAEGESELTPTRIHNA